MLRDDIYKYTELTGEDGYHAPIMKIGAYLDGYEKGLSILDEIRAEISENADRLKDSLYGDGLRHSIEIIDKYRAESEVEHADSN